MTGLALGLVLAAAGVHAGWNLIAKRADQKLAFLWCSALVSVVMFLPLGAWLLATRSVPPSGWVVLIASALLEAAYYWSLAQAYRYGDLSQVYPIARGTAPLCVPLLAAVFLGERPSLGVLAGICVVVAGVLLLLLPSINPTQIGRMTSGRGTHYALLSGVIIATYSTLDKRGVELVLPTLYAYLLFAGLTLALVPLILPQWPAVAAEWRCHRGPILAVGALAPLAYGLVLIALSMTPVSSVAAAREVSVVIAAVLGAVVLREPYGRRRLFGSAWIALGLGLLVLG